MTCQSAPPGSTRPERRSPVKRPPVMPMMRRRPSGVSPSSCAAASAISAWKSGRRFNRFEEPEELAVRARRPAFLLLLPRVADRGAQRLEVGGRECRGEVRERGIVGEQALAPGVQAPVARAALRRVTFDLGEAAADRLRIDLAHQPADVLHLAALRLVAADALRLEYGLPEIRRHLDRLELRFRQPHQRDAERLQLVHFALLARLADNFLIHAIIIAPPCRSATDSAAHAARWKASRKTRSSARATRAPARETSTCPRATASRSRCAKASPTPSSTTATARSG